MQIKQVMTPDVEIIKPNDSLRTAAQMMENLDAGVLPVGENDRLIGMITDRDIAVRAVAKGLDPETATVRETMSGTVRYAFEDEQVDAVAQKMGQWHVRRLPVLNREKRLVGVVSLGDLMVGGAEGEADKTLRKNSE